jgi:hypothetical protein
MSKLGEYQEAIPGKPKIKRRNIRFDQETYDLVREYAKEHGWTFAKVIGEGVRLFLQLQPHLGNAIKKADALEGEAIVYTALRNDVERLDMELDETWGELGELPLPYDIDTKE